MRLRGNHPLSLTLSLMPPLSTPACHSVDDQRYFAPRTPYIVRIAREACQVWIGLRIRIIPPDWDTLVKRQLDNAKEWQS